jgi:hypothetical protein
MARVERVIRKADSVGAVIILGFFYFRQDEHLANEAAVKAGVVNAMKWLRSKGFRNVLVEVANEYAHPWYNHAIIKIGMADLIELAKQTAPEFYVAASGLGLDLLDHDVALASDFLLIHGNNLTTSQQVIAIQNLKKYGKPIVINEDPKGAETVLPTVQAGASWGRHDSTMNQHYPFYFNGTADNPGIYDVIRSLTR